MDCCALWNTVVGFDDTVEPPNKGHFGDSISSAVLSLVERLSSSRRFSMYRNYGEWYFFGLRSVSLVERFNIQCPFLGGSFIRGSTVLVHLCVQNLLAHHNRVMQFIVDASFFVSHSLDVSCAAF